MCEIKKLSEFVKHVECAYKEEVVLFRGQREDWALLPRIAREDLRFEGGPVAAEEAMLERFRREVRPYLARLPDNDYELLALAQHHGMATRFLDWTYNPLCALWFAVREPACEGNPGVVWVYVPNEEDFILSEELSEEDTPLDLKEQTKVLEPSFDAPRIRAQNAVLTCHGHLEVKDKCVPTRPFTPFEEDAHHKERIKKITVSASGFRGLRWQLDRCGVNEASMFPTLDGLARHISWTETVLRDEETERNPPS